MTKYIATFFISILFSGCSSFSNERVAFIGEPIKAERTDESCESYNRSFWERSNDDIKEVCMSSVFKLQYYVNEPIQGNISKGPIKFVGFYHYRGMPSYLGFVDALVVLKRVNFGFVLEDIEGVEKQDGQWVTCAKWADDLNECLEYIPVDNYVETFNK